MGLVEGTVVSRIPVMMMGGVDWGSFMTGQTVRLSSVQAHIMPHMVVVRARRCSAVLASHASSAGRRGGALREGVLVEDQPCGGGCFCLWDPGWKV